MWIVVVDCVIIVVMFKYGDFLIFDFVGDFLFFGDIVFFCNGDEFGYN